MKKYGMLLFLMILAAVLALAGPDVIRNLTASHPGSMPVDQKKSELQAYYDARVEYAGDSSAVGNLLNILDIGRFGHYTIAMETDTEPYGLIINFSDIKVSGDLLDYREKGRADEAFYILALVENLNCVEVRFEAYTYRITAEEANAFIGGDIKDYGESPQKLEELHSLLNNQE